MIRYGCGSGMFYPGSENFFIPELVPTFFSSYIPDPTEKRDEKSKHKTYPTFFFLFMVSRSKF
jgi:hypothetical protein